jgi:hypothetical protein
LRGQAASFITVAQVALAQVGAERTSVPGVWLRSSADDSFGLSDGSSIVLKKHRNTWMGGRSKYVAEKPVNIDKMILKTSQGVENTTNSFSSPKKYHTTTTCSRSVLDTAYRQF